MKNLILTAILLFVSFTAFAQSAYDKIMAEKISKIETHMTTDDFTALANDFDRIGTKEVKQWQPYYFAAFSTIQKGRLLMRENNLSELDVIASQADKYITKAEELSPNNAEIYILKKMSASLKMMVDPMSRFMTFGQEAQQHLAKAKSLDAENPRITLLEAEDTYFTPEQFGGSKTKGIELFKKALSQFGTYKPKTNLDPNWGRAEAEYFINQAK
ncbi:hypothetical protein G6R40_10260 [Chryseobacterium sp. POL2]|uniref:hypothetical protein n=1 Tax=Chryseobacterium sp. POL2 TaxID=2713414 RepID=UPI0013E1F1ED|nr:hypothetical protein [Chryseobacterium sp. POL2]QIG90019.1 hypothetical protein G6R40_10260 [Chryseobacterium sp. POL2]